MKFHYFNHHHTIFQLIQIEEKKSTLFQQVPTKKSNINYYISYIESNPYFIIIIIIIIVIIIIIYQMVICIYIYTYIYIWIHLFKND